MCAPVGLQVQPHNLYNAHFFNLRWQQIDLCADQVRDGKRFLAWKGVDADGVVSLYSLIDLLLNVMDALSVQILHSEIHTCSIRVHLSTCDLHAEFPPDSAT